MAPCNNDLDIFTCTLDTCCWDQGYLEYPPNLAGTVAYLVIFAVFLSIQVFLGIRYRTWGFAIGTVCGLILEVIGYGGRLAVRKNPFDINIFLLYFIPLGLGPVFVTASIYLTLARLVNVYGTQYSRLKPRSYTVIFLIVDIASLIIQAVGGSLSAAATTDQSRQKGVDALIAGLTFQAVSLLSFIGASAWFATRVRRGNAEDRNAQFAALRGTTYFKSFIWAIATAAIAIFIRCVYRVIELSQGFSGPIANSEPVFLVLEGPMIMIAILLMTVCHPGLVFHDQWKSANWRFRTHKDTLDSSEHDATQKQEQKLADVGSDSEYL